MQAENSAYESFPGPLSSQLTKGPGLDAFEQMAGVVRTAHECDVITHIQNVGQAGVEVNRIGASPPPAMLAGGTHLQPRGLVRGVGARLSGVKSL